MNSKRQVRKQLEKAIRESPTFVIAEVVQVRPYTMVQLQVVLDGITYNQITFSKVSWPDQWDETYGKELCIVKGVSQIARSHLASKVITLAPALAAIL